MTGPDDGLRAAIVLAGGRSSRFGDADKVTADVAGTPMVARTVGRVERAVDGVVVSCRRDQVVAVRTALAAHRDHVAVVPDPVADRGPVAGIAAAVRAIRAPRVAVVAADNPLVEPALLEFLLDRLVDAEGAVPAPDGRPNPAQAAVRREALEPASRSVLSSGAASLMALLEAVDPVVVPEAVVRRHATPASFTDVNTTGDLSRAVEALSPGRSA